LGDLLSQALRPLSQTYSDFQSLSLHSIHFPLNQSLVSIQADRFLFPKSFVLRFIILLVKSNHLWSTFKKIGFCLFKNLIDRTSYQWTLPLRAFLSLWSLHQIKLEHVIIFIFELSQMGLS
jgi:hypothetical protein